MNKLRGLLYRLRKNVLWLIIAIFILSANWAADIIQKSVELILAGDVEISYLGLLCVIFFLLMSFILSKSIFNPFPRTRYMNDIEEPEKRSHLVIFLSELNNAVELTEGIPEWINLTGELKKDFEMLVKLKTESKSCYWKWEMPLRAIEHHVGELNNIIVICSIESILQYEWFKKILYKYSELHGIDISVLVKKDNLPYLTKCYDKHTHVGWNFEKFDELSKALNYLIKELFNKGVSEKDIMIDFTGGIKVTSVVAAAISFNRKIKAQYVKTNPNWEAVSYDVVFESSKLSDINFTA